MNRRWDSRTIWPVVFAVVAGACGGGADTTSPAERAVVIETVGCGFADARFGSGIVVGRGLIVTAAHLVIEAETVSVSVAAGETASAEVRVIDPAKDIALLAIADRMAEDVVTAVAAVGDEGTIVGGAVSGTVPFTVEQIVNLSIEEVLGSTRHERFGYKLDAATATGDSGAGVYDENNRLVGMVFAVSTDDGATWATASEELLDVVNRHDVAADPLMCDPAESRIVTS